MKQAGRNGWRRLSLVLMALVALWTIHRVYWYGPDLTASLFFPGGIASTLVPLEVRNDTSYSVQVTVDILTGPVLRDRLSGRAQRTKPRRTVLLGPDDGRPLDIPLMDWPDPYVVCLVTAWTAIDKPHLRHREAIGCKVVVYYGAVRRSGRHHVSFHDSDLFWFPEEMPIEDRKWTFALPKDSGQ